VGAISHPRWVVAQTQPLCENRATRHIVRQGGEVFSPLFYDRWGKTLRLFPGYLFVHIEGTASWLQNTMGVLRVLAMGARACEVSPQIVESYQVLADEVGVVCLPDATNTFREGQSVRITDGPFVNHVGIVEGMDAQQRVAILLSILGRESRVHCPVTLVAAV
jgi:transcriptional antiterminator RfaH